jgi:hypothetical protein
MDALSDILDFPAALVHGICPANCRDGILHVAATKSTAERLDHKARHRIRRGIPSRFGVKQVDVVVVSESEYEALWLKTYGPGIPTRYRQSENQDQEGRRSMSFGCDAARADIQKTLVDRCPWVNAWPAGVLEDLVQEIVTARQDSGKVDVQVTEGGVICILSPQANKEAEGSGCC